MNDFYDAVKNADNSDYHPKAFGDVDISDQLLLPLTKNNASIILVYNNASTATGTVTANPYLSFRITSPYPAFFEIEGCDETNGNYISISTGKRTQVIFVMTPFVISIISPYKACACNHSQFDNHFHFISDHLCKLSKVLEKCLVRKSQTSTEVWLFKAYFFLIARCAILLRRSWTR